MRATGFLSMLPSPPSVDPPSKSCYLVLSTFFRFKTIVLSKMPQYAKSVPKKLEATLLYMVPTLLYMVPLTFSQLSGTMYATSFLSMLPSSPSVITTAVDTNGCSVMAASTAPITTE